MFALALPVVAAVLLADRWPLAAGLWILAVGALVAWRGTRRSGLTVVLLASLAAGTLLWRNHCRDEAGKALAAAGETQATGRCLEDAPGDGDFWQVRVKLESPPAPGATVLWRGSGPTPVRGAILQADGRFRRLDQPLNPGEFDSAVFLKRHNVSAQFIATNKPHTIRTGFRAAKGAEIRHGFRNAVTDGLNPESPSSMTIRAVVIGEYPENGDALVQAFRNSGTLHLFSVSGMHVGMMAAIGWLLLKWMGVPRRSAVGLLLVLVFGYSWLTGNNPPAVRAAWMTAVFLGSFVVRRRPDLLNTLGLVLLATTLWDGNQLFRAGVQLSYGVVAAIALLFPFTIRWFAWMARPDPFMPAGFSGPWRRNWLKFRERSRDALGVSTAASIGSTPLIAGYFGLFTPVSVIATPLLALPVFGILLLALLSATVHPLSPAVSRGLNRVNSAVAWLCHRGAEQMAALPGACFNVRTHAGPMLVSYHLPYGAGAAVLSHGDGSGTLFDCGDRFGFRIRVAPSLRRLGIEPDTVALSHPDASHLGGASQVWTGLPIRRVVLPVERSLSKVYQSWVTDAPADGVTPVIPETGGWLELSPDARLEFLHVPAGIPHTRRADERVLISRLH